MPVRSWPRLILGCSLSFCLALVALFLFPPPKSAPPALARDQPDAPPPAVVSAEGEEEPKPPTPAEGEEKPTPPAPPTETIKPPPPPSAVVEPPPVVIPKRVDPPDNKVITVKDSRQLRRELLDVKPGTTIRIAPGTYRGDLSIKGRRGEPERPIIVEAADPEHPPVITGGIVGMYIADPSYFELRDLILSGINGNGLNIDDGGTYDTPARYVTLRNIVVRDIGPEGNIDAIKLSGLEDFLIVGCTVERWGGGGSGIDMVGCHRGQIVDCRFLHGNDIGGNGLQVKGGSLDILIMGCRFEHAGNRAVNIGGSTAMQFFRPRPQGYEAKDITVEDCTFLGSMSPVAFVGADGGVVRNNTFYRPRHNVLRILQETEDPEFVPCRNGKFTDNLIAFRSGEITEAVNVGPGTAPETFEMSRNAWYCIDDPGASRPRASLPESGGLYGHAPPFRDAERGDLRLRPGSPLGHLGARARPPAEKAKAGAAG